ncbi:MAG: hypothetical protein MNPFHGCM_02757 [Gemmatimonadaceae bacterium]|nr:hypothetical protein [Gemmatimonadaceae bacterium]
MRPPLAVDANAAMTEAPPIPVVESAIDIGTVVQNAKILGRDGAISGRIGNKSVWTFGDTPLAVPGVDQRNWVDNSLSWTTDLDASDGIKLSHDILDTTGAPAEFLPYTDFESSYNYAHDTRHCTAQPCGAEYALWPGDIIADPKRNRALVFYFELWRIPGQSGWTNIGTGIAIGEPGRVFTRPILRPGTPDPTLMWDSTEVAYGNGSTVVNDTVVTYGCVARFLVMRCRVARVPLEDILVKSRWEYYAGRGVWNSDPAAAVSIMTGGAAGNTIFYNAYLGLYVAVYSGVFSDDVFFRVARNAWGPWSAQTKLFTARPGWNGTTSYAGQAHPEFSQQNGKVVFVTYAHTTGFFRMDLPIVKVTFR